MEFRLPDIGEGVAEGEVVKWLVAEGAEVREDQPMVSVMTDKATVEITCPANGKIGKIVAAEGQTIPVGAVMVVIETAAGYTPPSIPAHGTGGHATPAPSAPMAVLSASLGGNGAGAPAPVMRSKTLEVPGLPGGMSKTV